jgi:hypothetical protein
LKLQLGACFGLTGESDFSSLPEESWIPEMFILENAFVVDAFTAHFVGGMVVFFLFVSHVAIFFVDISIGQKVGGEGDERF